MREEHLEKRQRTREPLKRQLLRNAPWLALGLAVLLFGLHLLGQLFTFPAGVVEAQSALASATARVTAATGETRFLAADANSQAATAAADARRGLLPLPGKPPRLARRVAYPDELLKAAVSGEKNEVLLFPPRDLRADAERGSIKLRWLVDSSNNVTVSRFVVWRSDSGKPFAALPGVVSGTTTTFADESVTAGVTYSYKVVAVTDDPLLVRQGKAESDPSTPVSVDAVADYKIALVSCSKEGTTATLEVEKWHEDAWWKKSFTVGEGQVVGEVDSGTGVDYGTRRRVKSVLRTIQESDVTVREVVFMPDGTVRMDGGVPVTEEVEAKKRRSVVTVVLEGAGVLDKTYTLNEDEGL